jgi:poly(hydroxyalkanoate) depolymerase family esterase
MPLRRNLRSLRRGVRLALRLSSYAFQLPPRPQPKQGADLQATAAFGPDPGRLRMLTYAPQPTMPPYRPLVVLLHGCGQDAAGFAAASGWMALAKRLRLPLLLPEQASVNHSRRCFRWFQPAHTRRDHGEAGSIASMVRAAIRRFRTDPDRVFIVGLSAGGAMAAALLAAYPDLFAGGAVVAGLPVGAANSTAEALLRMSQPGPALTPGDWAAKVRERAPQGFAGPWPKLSIWHGGADPVVAPENAGLLADQWRALHGLPDTPDQDEQTGPARHRRWQEAVELWTLPALVHAYPVANGAGEPQNFVLNHGLSATEQVARFWRLA